MGRNWPFLAGNIVAPLAFSCLKSWDFAALEVCPDPFPANFTGSGPGRDRGFRDRDGIGICPRVPRRDPSRDPSRDWPGLETITYVTAVHM